MSVDAIRSFIVDEFLFGEGKDLTDSTPLLETHIIDSTGVLEIISFLEERFKISVEDHELIPENLNTLKSIENFLKRKNVALD